MTIWWNLLPFRSDIYTLVPNAFSVNRDAVEDGPLLQSKKIQRKMFNLSLAFRMLGWNNGLVVVGVALALIEVLAVVLVIVIGDCVVVLVSVRLDSLIIQSASSRVSWRSAKWNIPPRNGLLFHCWICWMELHSQAVRTRQWKPSKCKRPKLCEALKRSCIFSRNPTSWRDWKFSSNKTNLRWIFCTRK